MTYCVNDQRTGYLLQGTWLVTAIFESIIEKFLEIVNCKLKIACWRQA